jgi:lipid II:glycine glycyltransferase (peptidoglycan interpeptide bridge formation enzyme)
MIPHVFRGDATEDALRSCWQRFALNEDAKFPVHRTIRVNLDRPLADIRKGLQSRWRSYLNAAEKAGFEVVEGTGDEFYGTFLQMYHELMARKQFDTSVDVEAFGRVQRSLPDTLKMRVFVCKKDGAALNSLVVSNVGDTGIYLLAATTDAGLKARGAYVLQWRAIEYLQGCGCRWYDLGGIDRERNPGVYQFKSGLGGDEVLQLGRYELSGGLLSSVVVGIGERLQKVRVG